MLICDYRHLNTVLNQYLAHYDGHRRHRALGPRRPDAHPRSEVLDAGSPILWHDVLGGLIHEYRAA